MYAPLIANRYRKRAPKRSTSDVTIAGIRCSAAAIGVSITARTEHLRHERSSASITCALRAAIANSESVKMTACAVPPESAIA